MESIKPTVESFRPVESLGPVESYNDLFSAKNTIIIALCILLLLSFLFYFSIGDTAFGGCTLLTTVTLSNNLTMISKIK